MIRKEREIKVIYVLVLAIFAVFLAVPIVRLLLESFLGEAGQESVTMWKSSQDKGSCRLWETVWLCQFPVL